MSWCRFLVFILVVAWVLWTLLGVEYIWTGEPVIGIVQIVLVAPLSLVAIWLVLRRR